MYRNLVFSGGGIACIASFSCAQTLKPYLKNVTTIAGSSGGALTAALIAMDADSECVYVNFVKIISESKMSTFVSVKNIFENFGAVPSDVVLKPIIFKIFMDAYNMTEACRGNQPSYSSPTFRQFAITTGKNLIIPAVNVSRSKPVFFSVDTHPDQDVIDAITASCCVPLIFSPVIIDGEFYVDAGITDNLPLSAISKDGLPHQTLAIDTIPENLYDERRDIKDITGFLKATLQTVLLECNNRRTNTIPECDHIHLNSGGNMSMHMESFIGKTDQRTMDMLYNEGIAAAKKFMDSPRDF
jgi:predicted acylesterase/phospholipase RssA